MNDSSDAFDPAAGEEEAASSGTGLVILLAAFVLVGLLAALGTAGVIVYTVGLNREQAMLNEQRAMLMHEKRALEEEVTKVRKLKYEIAKLLAKREAQAEPR
jgi:hypothetical protein